MMTEQLRQVSYIEARGEQSPILFIEADEMTDAAQPVGDYTIEGDTLRLSVILVRTNAPISKESIVTGKASEMEKTVKRMVEIVIQSLQRQ